MADLNKLNQKSNKTEIGLSAFFLRFLLHIILSVILTGISWLILLSLAIRLQIVLPANNMEMEVRAFSDSLSVHTPVTPDMIPGGAGYAIYDKNGLLQETNLSDPLLEKTDFAVTSKQDSSAADLSGRVYLTIETDTQILVLTYRIRSVFSNLALRRLFPDAEVFELAVFFLFLIINLIFVIMQDAKRLTKELLILQNAADQIREQNLDFQIERTRIREFNQVADSLDALRTELSHSLKEQWYAQQQKKRQLSALAHDIKTPLTIVRGNAELLSETDLNSQQASYHHFILKNTEQIQNYVAKMMEAAREDTMNDTDFAPVSFRQFLDELCENTKSLGQKKELSILFVSETLPELLPFPEASMKRILNNLLDNAVYYSPCRGTVTLHTRINTYINNAFETSSSHTLQFTVTDEGYGFSVEALRLGTEEFYQADTSRSDHMHFGMGLTIVKQLVSGMGGTLRLGNRAEGGGMVVVEVPIKE